MDKHIYFSTFNALNGKWITVDKLVTPSVEFEKITSQIIGNLVVFYTLIHFIFPERDVGLFLLILLEKQKQSNNFLYLNAEAEIA